MSNWLLCLPCSILFIFSKRKCISKSWRKLMNYKPENRIPWPFTDFEKFVFPWLFPDRGNPAVTSQQISPLPQIIEYRETSGWFEFKCGQPQDITGLLFQQSGVVRCFCWGHVNCSSPANAQSLKFSLTANVCWHFASKFVFATRPSLSIRYMM